MPVTSPSLLTPFLTGTVPAAPSMTLAIREFAPLRLDVDVATPDNHHAHWSPDEPNPANVPGAMSFSSTMPGGDEQFSCVLTRDPSRDYPDLEELSHIRVRGAGGQIAWGGRLERTPRQSGDQLSVNPAAVGYQAHLDDDASAREIYLDSSQANWVPASLQRKINLDLASVDTDDPSTVTDPATGFPSVETSFQGPWTRTHSCEAWYDAKHIPIGKLYYAWRVGTGVDPFDANWAWGAVLCDDDVASSSQASAPLRAVGPGTGVLAASTATRRWALLQLAYAPNAGTSGRNYALDWTFTGILGTHGLPVQGTLGATGGIGLLASDIIANAVGRWAPELSFSTGPDGTIRPSTFVIGHMAFTDPTTASQIIKAAAAFGLPDWGVFDGPNGPTFFCAPRGTFGKSWRARVYPAKLQATGPDVQHLYNGCLVTFTDVSGITRTVGPPGSGADTEDASLLDPDPLNPVNQAGIKRYTPLQMGTGTAPGAIKVGATFLQAQKELDNSGQASLVGHVEDSHGVMWPAWRVKAGDSISFVDAHDNSPRRVVQASYDDPTKTCTVQLDAPPQGLEWLLARLGAVIQPLGF